MSDPQIRAGGLQEFDASDMQLIATDDLLARRRVVAPDGTHLWAVGVLYGLDDPDEALDTMELDASKLVGFLPIHCMLCHTEYLPAIRHERCSQPASS